MSDFKREERYTVVKHKDITLDELIDVRNYLARRGVPTRTCAVVEPDWPIYGLVWKMIESLANGKAPIDPKLLAADLNAALEREKSLSARIEFLNQQNTEQQEQNDALAAHVELLSDNLRKQAEGQQLPQETTATSLTAICPDCEGDGNMACTTCSICDGLGALSTEELARLHAERLAEQINNCELECGAYGTYCKCADEKCQQAAWEKEEWDRKKVRDGEMSVNTFRRRQFQELCSASKTEGHQ